MAQLPFERAHYVHGNSFVGSGWVWLCIPKNASTSLTKVLSRHGTQWVRAPITDARPVHTFAFLRDPAERIASAWRNKVRDASIIGDRRLLERWPDLREDMSLEEFIEWMTPRKYKNPHWLPQSRFVLSAEGKRVVQTLATIEQIPTVLERLANKFQLSLSALPRRNVSEHREQVSIEARNAIRDLYTEDYALLEAARLSS